MISTHILFLVGIDLDLASLLMVLPSDWTFAELLSELLNYRRQSSGSLSKGQEIHSIDDILSNLHGSQSEDKDCVICVVVHNIDGPALRDPDSQQTLVQLASCSHIRIVASIDHVDAPLCKELFSVSLLLIANHG